MEKQQQQHNETTCSSSAAEAPKIILPRLPIHPTRSRLKPSVPPLSLPPSPFCSTMISDFAANHHTPSSSSLPPPPPPPPPKFHPHHRHHQPPNDQLPIGAVFAAADASLAAFWLSAVAISDVNTASRRRRRLRRRSAAERRLQQHAEAADSVVEESVDAAARTQAAACIAWVLAAVSIVFADHDDEAADLYAGDGSSTDSDSNYAGHSSVDGDLSSDSASSCRQRRRPPHRNTNYGPVPCAYMHRDHNSRRSSRFGRNDYDNDVHAAGLEDPSAAVDTLSVRRRSGDVAAPSTFSYIYNISHYGAGPSVTVDNIDLSPYLRQCAWNRQTSSNTAASDMQLPSDTAATEEMVVVSEVNVGQRQRTPRWEWRPVAAAKGTAGEEGGGNEGGDCRAKEMGSEGEVVAEVKEAAAAESNEAAALSTGGGGGGGGGRSWRNRRKHLKRKEQRRKNASLHSLQGPGLAAPPGVAAAQGNPSR